MFLSQNQKEPIPPLVLSFVIGGTVNWQGDMCCNVISEALIVVRRGRAGWGRRRYDLVLMLGLMLMVFATRRLSLCGRLTEHTGLKWLWG